MSNFTKSIVYSGVVLVAGLIAVFTIYNNMGTMQGSTMSAIEPAAGGYTSEMPAAEDMISEDENMIEDAATIVDEEGIVEDATEEAMDHMPEGVSEEKAEAVEDAAEEAAEDAVEEHADESVEEIKDAAEEAAEDAAAEEAHEDETH